MSFCRIANVPDAASASGNNVTTQWTPRYRARFQGARPSGAGTGRRKRRTTRVTISATITQPPNRCAWYSARRRPSSSVRAMISPLGS
jgi:hypothetical protein